MNSKEDKSTTVPDVIYSLAHILQLDILTEDVREVTEKKLKEVVESIEVEK